MYSIGEQVVYPMHGAGTIVRIEEKEILGVIRSYYILEMSYGKMQVMVPVDGAEATGLRPVSDPSVLPSVLETLAAESTPMDENWNRRLRDNAEKIHTGDMCQVAGVIRNLARIERVKKLSSGEKKQLQTAKQILVSELILVKAISEQEALDLIDSTI